MSPVEHLQELHGLPAFDFPDPGTTASCPPRAMWPGGWPSTPMETPRRGSPTSGTDSSAPWTRPASARSSLVSGVRRTTTTPASSCSASWMPGTGSALRAVFIGDLEMEEAEISWIEQSDVTPVLEAYPLLEEFGVRGGAGLRFPASGTSICAGSGSRPAACRGRSYAVRFPPWRASTCGSAWRSTAAMRRSPTSLRSWRGDASRRCASRLRNDARDEIAAVVAGSPVVAQLTSLDLSLGVLTTGGDGAPRRPPSPT